MRFLRTAVFILFIIIFVLFSASFIYKANTEDETYPKITCAEDTLDVSISAGTNELLAGLSAYDEKDGNLTDSIIIEQISNFVERGVSTVTYVVMDSDNHTTKYKRKIRYTDYIPPRFSLTQNLSFYIGDTAKLTGILKASDVIDGDISDKMRMLSSTINTNIAGVYRIDVQVTNSRGDYSTLSLPVTVKEVRFETPPTIDLKEYLVYAKTDDVWTISTISGYIAEAYENDKEKTEIPLSQVSVRASFTIGQPFGAPGIYQIVYVLRDDGENERQTATLFIKVEE